MAERIITLATVVLAAVTLTAAPAQADSDRTTTIPECQPDECRDTVPNNPHDWPRQPDVTAASTTTSSATDVTAQAHSEDLTTTAAAEPVEAPPTYTG